MPLSPSARLRYPAAWPAISAGIRTHKEDQQ